MCARKSVDNRAIIRRQDFLFAPRVVRSAPMIPDNAPGSARLNPGFQCVQKSGLYRRATCTRHTAQQATRCCSLSLKPLVSLSYKFSSPSLLPCHFMRLLSAANRLYILIHSLFLYTLATIISTGNFSRPYLVCQNIVEVI